MFFFLPIGHDQSIRRTPWVTAVLLALCVAVFFLQRAFAVSPEAIHRAMIHQHRCEEAVLERWFGEDPARTEPPTDAEMEHLLVAVRAHQVGAGEPTVAALLAADAAVERLRAADPTLRFGYRPRDGLSLGFFTHAFLHGGLMHLIGNMVFLWLAGCTVEARWGPLPYLGTYLASLVGAAFAYRLVHPGGEVVLIGASGAIAGAMAAFFVSFLRARVKFAYFAWLFVYVRFGTFTLPALVVFPVWFLSQLAQTFLEATRDGGGVAYSAHVGGFVIGAAIAVVVRASGLEKRWVDDFTRIEEEVLAAGGGVEYVPRARAEVRPILGARTEPVAPIALEATAADGPFVATSAREVHEVAPPVAPLPVAPLPAAPLELDAGWGGRIAPDAASLSAPPPPLTPPRELLLEPLVAAVPEVGPPPEVAAAPFEIDVLGTFEDALARADAAALGRIAPAAFAALSAAGRHADLARGYRALEAFGAPIADGPLGLVVRAATETADVRLAVRATARLQDDFPGSAHLPRALFDVARAQEAAGHGALARKTLQRLADEHPDDHHAAAARSRLGVS